MRHPENGMDSEAAQDHLPRYGSWEVPAALGPLVGYPERARLEPHLVVRR
jgi:hypothetical protein